MTECEPSLLASGIPAIAWIANHLRVTWLTPLVKLISDLGTEGSLIFTIAIAYWLWNKRYTKYLGYAMFTALMINLLIKGWVMECRPPKIFWLETIHDNSYSFPSGHTQVAFPLWLGLAYYVRHKGLTILYTLIGLLIALSRPYLGVHFPHDVAAGAILGLAIYCSFIIAEQKQWAPLQQYRFSHRCLIIALLLGADLLLSHQITKSVIATQAAFIGFWLGCECETRWLHFSPPQTILQRLKLTFIGLFGILVIYKGLVFFGNPTNSLMSTLLRIMQYSLLGWWITFAAPLLAKHLRQID